MAVKEDVYKRQEEMNAAGAQEFLASAMLPAELWQESGRWDVYGAEMFRLKDRNNSCLLYPSRCV